MDQSERSEVSTWVLIQALNRRQAARLKVIRDEQVVEQSCPVPPPPTSPQQQLRLL